MPSFDWYKIFNQQDFIDSELVSKEATINFGLLGTKTILITKGIGVGVLVDDVFLPVELNEKNPFRIGERAVYLDENDDVWIGMYNAN